MVVLPGVTRKFAPLAVVPIGLPPEGTVYQLMLLPLEMAFRLEEPPLQIELGVAVTDVGGAGIGVTVTVTATRAEEVQPLPAQEINTCPSPERTPAMLLWLEPALKDPPPPPTP